jgi:hypothetical protein
MEAILDSPHLAGLTHCQSWGNRFTPETWQRTRARFGTDVGF